MDLDFEKSIKEIESKITELKTLSQKSKVNFTSEINELEKRCQQQIKNIYNNLTPWQILQIARHPNRPVFQDYVNLIFESFMELIGF